MTPAEIADRCEELILELADNAAQRRYARIILRNRFSHPEIGATSPRERGADLASYRPPPPSTGDNAANRASRPCARCGKARALHDLDGERTDCDGYVGAP